MEEFGKTIAEHFKRHIAYINVLKNTPVDCGDIGSLGSADILAVAGPGTAKLSGWLFREERGSKMRKKTFTNIIDGMKPVW